MNQAVESAKSAVEAMNLSGLAQTPTSRTVRSSIAPSTRAGTIRPSIVNPKIVSVRWRRMNSAMRSLGPNRAKSSNSTFDRLIRTSC